MASDLDTAIKIHQEALRLTLEDHGARAEKLSLIGGGHWNRFCRDKNQVDMNTAI
jgi:predicted TPR repeat methyltransferase